MYKRRGSSNYQSKVLTPKGYVTLSWRTVDLKLVKRMEHMWECLARQRAWDLLQPVLDGTVSVGELFDLWELTKHNHEAMRSRQANVLLAPFAKEWETWHALSGRGQTSHCQATAHVAWLLTRAINSSSLDSPSIVSAFSQYPGSVGTKRKVHTSWTSFLGYLVTRGCLSSNPMTTVPRPSSTPRPVSFYEMSQVDQLLLMAPTDAMRSLWAFLYGTSADLDSALQVTKADVNRDSRTVHVIGTKNSHRDRNVRVADWAWPFVDAHLHGVAGSTKLWPWDRSWPSHEHLRVVRSFEGPVYPLRNARHHWAATRLRAGWPIGLVQKQLGHSSPRLTLEIYGRFIPSDADYTSWERKFTNTLPGDIARESNTEHTADRGQ